MLKIISLMIIIMLTSSSNYNSRQAQSKQNKKISLPKNKHKSLEKSSLYPQQLLTQTPLEANNPSQSFYRTSAPLVNNKKIVKLGWRVIQLSIDQVDLALYCLSMLQSKMTFPMKFYSKTQSNKNYQGNDIYQDVWVQWQIMQDKNKISTRGFELAVYKFCQTELIPKVRDFINRYITWSYMCLPSYEDKKVITKFDKEVTVPLVAKIKEFRPIILAKVK